MKRASSQLRTIAKRLMASEALGNTSAKVDSPAAFRATDKLRPHLSLMMGRGGFQALLARHTLPGVWRSRNALSQLTEPRRYVAAFHAQSGRDHAGAHFSQAHVQPCRRFACAGATTRVGFKSPRSAQLPGDRVPSNACACDDGIPTAAPLSTLRHDAQHIDLS